MSENLISLACAFIGCFLLFICFKVIYSKSKKRDEKRREKEEKNVLNRKRNAFGKDSDIQWNEKLEVVISRPKRELWKKLEALFQNKEEISVESWSMMEEMLYSADIGPLMASSLLVAFRDSVKGKKTDPSDFKNFFFHFLKEKLSSVQEKINPLLHAFSLIKNDKNLSPRVIMVVGINGAGKTTSVGKLASRLKEAGNKVVIGACDTFRAAACEQLLEWGRRAQTKVVTLKEGTPPSAVAFEALKVAQEEEADYLILDTAGRLHTKENLMDELKKMKRVLAKLDPLSPHEVFLVIDAITGQNAIRQAEEFNNALGLTGLIFTKCDGTSKAGTAVSIVSELKVPIVYLGIGEKIEDLNVFHLDDYLKALLCID